MAKKIHLTSLTSYLLIRYQTSYKHGFIEKPLLTLIQLNPSFSIKIRINTTHRLTVVSDNTIQGPYLI